ncbi:MAG: hypothetical protein SFZ23_10475 [Planctomycetota bacterium]|nr:hypothetical protein [Planctomycetota bacterium]
MTDRPSSRFIQPRVASQQPAASAEPKDLGFTSAPAATARMLDIGLKSGDRIALPYAYLIAVELSAGTALRLTFTEHLVTVTGRNLSILYKHILAQTAKEIDESTAGFDDNRTQSWVESVAIETR